MKQLLKSLFCALLLLTPAGAFGRNNCSDDCSFSCDDVCSISCSNDCSISCSDNCSTSCSNDCSRDCYTDGGFGYVNFRSQGANTARELVGFEEFIYRPDLGGCGVASLTFEYTQSFKSRKIANALFGTDRLVFQGSAITGAARTPNAFVADYFGLPNTFTGSIGIRPKIQNFIFELDSYFPLDACNSWFFRFNAPLVHTRWDLGLGRCDENVVTSSQFGPCQLAVNSVPTAASLKDALSGNFTVNGLPLLCNGIFPRCRQSKTRLADIDLILGGYVYNDDCGHLGFFGQLVLPTGNRQSGREIFKPIVGNGHHLEIGGGVTAHRVLWQNKCDQELAVYLEGNITHMLSTRQCRLLDFCKNGAFSRYLLLREFETDGITPTGNLVSATCFNNRPVDVKVNIKGDASLKFAYRWCNWTLDVGYNIYGHSKESIKFADDCNSCNTDIRKYGIAGTSGVCCNTYVVTPGVPGATDCLTIASTTPVSVGLQNATYSNAANAFNPTFSLAADNVVVPVIEPIGGINTVCVLPGVPVVAGTTLDLPTQPCAVPGSLTADSLALPSVNPHIATRNDLNPQSAAAAATFSNKVFAHASYTWFDDCGWNPNLGIGGEGEFGSCKYGRGSLSQWGVWVKGIVTF